MYYPKVIFSALVPRMTDLSIKVAATAGHPFVARTLIYHWTSLVMLSSDRTQNALALWLTPVVLYVLYAWLKVITGALFGPLSKIPGPKLWAISRLPRMYMEWKGEEAAGVDALHKKYGPVVRLAPNEVSFAGGAQAWVRLRGKTCP
jgi:hypothetical protein